MITVKCDICGKELNPDQFNVARVKSETARIVYDGHREYYSHGICKPIIEETRLDLCDECCESLRGYVGQAEEEE